ncbi:MAG: hypothetical protein IJZ59_00515 [Alphaproteobacteria bacterium]|nr:hypothetical protein [Alphaproteobacteria bacterium]
MKLRLSIDVKSLYLNIKNDNASGHTATVATPIKQYNSWNDDLINIFKLPENINNYSKENIIDKLLSKSRAKVKINNVYIFDKISVNGILLENAPSFCMYVREEISEGYIHYGRQKLHYPISFKYNDIEVDINNSIVLKMISETLHNYAFIIEAFEYDTSCNLLDFKATIVGANSIPYSKVFVNRKGVGNKFSFVFNETSDSYDAEIIALREKLGFDNVSPNNFSEVMENNKNIANQLALKYIAENEGINIRLLTDDYPYALYDYEYEINNKKQFMIIRYTATKNKYFNLSMQKVRFINDFHENTKVMLITNINEQPEYHIYNQDKMNQCVKNISSVCYRDTEDI